MTIREFYLGSLAIFTNAKTLAFLINLNILVISFRTKLVKLKHLISFWQKLFHKPLGCQATFIYSRTKKV